MRRSLSSLLVLLLIASTAEAKVRVVTTIQTFRSLAEEVGGDKVEVTALVGDDVDPHRVDPRPSYALTLNRADLLVLVGLELERAWLPPLIAQARNPRIQAGRPGYLDASTTGVLVLDAGGATSRAGGDIHPLGNPHYWLPPENAARVATAIADRLAELDPGNASYYRARVGVFRAALEERRAAWQQRARALAGVKVVTYHRSWTYLTRWLGLDEIGAIEPKPGVPPDPAHLAGLVKQARTAGVRLVILESYYPRNTAQRIAELGGMRMVVLPSDGRGGYFALVDHILGQLLDAAR